MIDAIKSLIENEYSSAMSRSHVFDSDPKAQAYYEGYSDALFLVYAALNECVADGTDDEAPSNTCCVIAGVDFKEALETLASL